MADPAAPPPRRDRALAALCGVLLITCFFGLGETAQGLHISFLGEANRSSTGEVYFWLGAALLLLPGAALLGSAAGASCDGALGRMKGRLDRLLARLGPTWAARLAGAVAFAVAVLGRRFILLGCPITDDEAHHRFGGQVLALGRLTVELPVPLDAFPNRFIWLDGARGTSMEWPGIQLVWALAEITHLGSLVFALFAALPAFALTRLLWRRLSPSAAALGLLLWLFSPMGFALSLTTHGHLLSRGLLALGILYYDEAVAAAGDRGDRGDRRRLLLAGLCVGGAFICRTPETAALALPLLLSEVRLWLGGGADAQPARRRLGWILLGAVAPLLIFLIHPLLVSGSPMPLRFTPQRGGDFYAEGSLWHRFGAAFSYNLLMLLVWALGPLGLAALPLWALGGGADRLTRALLWGVLVDLLITLVHDIGSIHVVGPIHYSECAVPLVLIATHGAVRGWRMLRPLHPQRPASWTGAALAMIVLGLGTFNGVHAKALRRQAELQASIYAALEQQVAALGGPPVLVVAPRFQVVAAGHPLGRSGTKVFDWRRPRPDFSDPILVAHEVPGWELLRARFPGRRVLRLTPTASPPYFQLTPLAN